MSRPQAPIFPDVPLVDGSLPPDAVAVVILGGPGSGKGTLSDKLSAKALARAAILEAEAWRQGQRDPQQIAAWAQQHMHATHVAQAYATLLSKVAS